MGKIKWERTKLSALDYLSDDERDRKMMELAFYLKEKSSSYAEACSPCSLNTQGVTTKGGGWCCLVKSISDLDLPAVRRDDFVAVVKRFGFPLGWEADCDQTYNFYLDQALFAKYEDEMEAADAMASEATNLVDAAQAEAWEKGTDIAWERYWKISKDAEEKYEFREVVMNKLTRARATVGE